MITQWSPFVSRQAQPRFVMPQSKRSLQFHYPLPYGAVVQEDGLQFVVYSKSATAMSVLLYRRVNDREPYRKIDFDPSTDRWGDLWSVFVPGLKPGQLYHFQADGPYNPEAGLRFNGQARLIDPYARALAGKFQPSKDGVIRPPKCVAVEDNFDWQGDRHLRRPLSETVIYEMHVRGFSRSSTSNAESPGTYLGVIEKIPYLKSLGVTAVELMPIHEFPINDPTGNVLERPNYWGYDSLAFFSPHRGYMDGNKPGDQVVQFKQMVRALHEAGIEVILDVVFNHTAEGNHLGPTVSFKGLQNDVYYMLNDDGTYKNYSGCGNTVNGNHPICRELIFHCLRHWVYNYHIDGFRFDLASILSRSRSGELVPNPPLVEVIAEDPMLADTKIIAEAWDAAGAFQVGSFADTRWAEWNGHYRDDVRRFWRGDHGLTGNLATRISGSSDLYEKSNRRPYHSINFVTSHDGYPLNDLVSYEQKHNQANGEDNRDGDNNNYSANYGVEGPTRRKHIVELRRRQAKNMMATMLLSQGTPMIVAGDEILRTQRGNNNAYCQDNAISWIDWRLKDKNEEMFRFCQALIAFRKQQPIVRRPTFLTGQPGENGELADVSWYDAAGKPKDWSQQTKSITCVFGTAGMEDVPGARPVMIMLHSGHASQEFAIPPALRQLKWSQFVDTSAETPFDVYPQLDGPRIDTSTKLRLKNHTLMCFVG